MALGHEQLYAGYLGEDVDASLEAEDAIRIRIHDDHGELLSSSWRLGCIDFCLFQAQAGVDVTPYRPHRTLHGFSVGLCVAGSVTVAQDGRRAELEPGDFTFYGIERPFQISAEDNHDFLVMRVPLYRIGLEPGAMDALKALKISSSTVSASILASTLTTIAAHQRDLSTSAQLHYADALCSMVQAVVAEAQPDDVNTQHLTLFNRMARWIEDRIRDENLTSERVAAAHHVSPRHVRAIFASNGTQVSTFVKERRLELARRDLSNPDLSHLSISQIAQQHGFCEPSIFSRGFRLQYGDTPSGYRKSNTRLLNNNASSTPTGPVLVNR
ncbi:helix-turn-helix domain-containing protein [Citricoccus sp. GCM10030269]|uniref:helix-turn-helix domain-containing protein n=1 Tax=Citricoccus sp. GCM10030269 TaxID=3273388 RepID=UPI003623DA3E